MNFEQAAKDKLREVAEHIFNARSEASSVMPSRDYIIDECCMAAARLAEIMGENSLDQASDILPEQCPKQTNA